MQLLGRKVLVEKIKPQEATASGVIIPMANRKKNEGTVIAVSDKAEFVKVGDTVRYFQGSGVPYEHEGKDCLFLREDHDIELIL